MFERWKQPKGFLKNGFTEMKQEIHQKLLESSTTSATDKPGAYDHDKLDNAYRNSPLLRKICDKASIDATAKWRTWRAPEGTDLQAIAAEEKRLNVRWFVAECHKRTRQFGSCMIVFHIKGQRDASQPVDFSTLPVGAISHLQIVTRRMINSIEFESDFGNPNHNKPNLIKVNTNDGVPGSTTSVHPSRMVIMTGERRSYESIGKDSQLYFGDAIIDALIPSVLNWESLYKNIAVMGDKFATPILYIDKIGKRIIQQNQKAALARDAAKAEGKISTVKDGVATGAELINAVNSLSGATGTMVLEKDTHKLEILPYDFGGLDPLLERKIKRIAAESGYPLTVLSGEHQPGLGSSGAGDIENYNTMIRGIQNDDIEPSLINLDRAIVASALGREPQGVCYVWNDLSETPLLDKANIYGIQIDRIIKQVESGLTSEDIGRKSIEKLMIEAGLSA